MKKGDTVEYKGNKYEVLKVETVTPLAEGSEGLVGKPIDLPEELRERVLVKSGDTNVWIPTSQLTTT